MASEVFPPGSAAQPPGPHHIERMCEDAIRRLENTPLTTKEPHDALYVPRDEPIMRRLLRRLELGALEGKAKLIFSGHVGSGKSSELYHLKRALEEKQRTTVLYWSIHKHANLVGLDTVRFLTAVARVLRESLGDQAPRDFDQRLQSALGTSKQVRRNDRQRTGHVGVAAEVGPLKAGGQLSATTLEQEEHTYAPPPGPEGILALVNQLLAQVRATRKDAPLLLICDDLEKLDLLTAAAVFSHGLALAEIDACVIFTVPISLLYSDRCQELLGPFDDNHTLLPVFKVRNRLGEPSLASIDRLRRLVMQRVPALDRLLTPDAFEALALASGGVLSDLITLMREVCFEALDAPDRVPFTSQILSKASARLRAEHFRQVPGSLYERLRAVAGDPDHRGGGGMDPELARLLALGAVLEYANDDFWYRVHPLALPLIRPDEPS